MLQSFNYYFQLFTEFAKLNPVIAGLVSLWSIGVITFLLKGVPTAIYKFTVRQCTTTLSMNNTQIGSNAQVFTRLITYLNTSSWAKYSRTLMIDGIDTVWDGYRYVGGGASLGIGEGTHFFIKNYRPFWVSREKIENKAATSSIFYEIKITMLGRNRDVLKNLYEEFNPEPVETELTVHTFNSNGEWSRLTSTQKRRLDTVIIANSVKEDLITKIEWFKANKQWYMDRGLPYKLTIVLHGPSGTGKTSLIKALGSHFNYGLGILDLNTLGKDNLQKAFVSFPKNTFILCEDFDSCSVLKKRKGIEDVRKIADVKKTTSESEDFTGRNVLTDPIDLTLSTLTLSSMLNIFDGAVSLDDSIIFLTTNVIDQIDPAFLRPGRVDYLIKVDYLEHDDIVKYVKLMFPNASIPQDICFQSIPGCIVQDKYFENKDDSVAFIESLQVTSVVKSFAIK